MGCHRRRQGQGTVTERHSCKQEPTRDALPPHSFGVHFVNVVDCGKGEAAHTPAQRARKNHLEERLLDQAQVRASYTPPFGGHSRSIHHGMILDVQPLVKSLFCPIRPSPNGFFDSEASIP